VEVSSGTPYVYALGFVSPDGTRKLLLVNKRDREFNLKLPEAASEVQYVDQTTMENPPAVQRLNSNTVKLRGLAVAAVLFK
jgi:hypothetical protein